MPPEFLTIARIVAPRGVRGEVRAEILSDFPERFKRLKQVLIGPAHQRFRVVSAQQHGRVAIFKLEGVDSIDQAEALRAKLVQIPLAEAVPLDNDQYYWHQIIGLEVITGQGRSLGRIVDILRTGVNDVYVVRADDREVLIPAIEDVVKDIDVLNGRMVVELLPGLLD